MVTHGLFISVRSRFNVLTFLKTNFGGTSADMASHVAAMSSLTRSIVVDRVNDSPEKMTRGGHNSSEPIGVSPEY